MEQNKKQFPCGDVKAVANKIYTIATDIENGLSISRACAKNGVNYAQFKRMVSLKLFAEGNPNSHPIKKMDDYESWEEQLLNNITGDNTHVVIENFEEVLNKAMAGFTDREQKIIYLRYKEGMDLESVAKVFGVTRERIRQQEWKTLRRLRHPSRIRYLLYGDNADYISEQEKKIKELSAHIEDYTRNRDELINSLNKTKTLLSNEIEQLSQQVAQTTQNVLADYHFKPLEDMELSVRSYNILARNKIRTVGELASLTIKDLMRIRNLGRRSLTEIVSVLKEQYNVTIAEE